MSLLDGEGMLVHPDLFSPLYVNLGAHTVYGSGPYFPVVQFLSATDPQPATYTFPVLSEKCFNSGKQMGITSSLKSTSLDSLTRARSGF